jgi:hypothetical protein
MYTDLKVWLDHFEYHAGRRCVLPEGRPDELTGYERRLIAASLRTFQREAQANGPCLIDAARRYDREHDLAPLAQIVELLVAEEEHHAELLGVFMDQHGVQRERVGWTDRVSRQVHRLAGFELQIATLVSAKLIGKVCYRALESATGCRQLQTLCRILVADELAHVGFESDLLRALHAQHPPLTRTALATAHRVLFTNASMAVWLDHRRMLRAAGYGMHGFVQACATQYAFYLEAPPRPLSPSVMIE